MELFFMSFAFMNLDTTSDPNYDYAGFVNSKNKVLIIRYDKLGTLARYYLTDCNYDIEWEHRIDKEYLSADKLDI